MPDHDPNPAPAPTQRAIRSWEPRKRLSLILMAALAAMIWLPWITGKPTIIILELPMLLWLPKDGPAPA